MRRLVGAGVLCASKNASGEIVLLLGKEREVPGWRHGSLKWCGFSGRAEEGETAIASASREFIEESCSAVMLTEGASLPARQDEVSRALQKSISVSHTVKAAPPSETLLCHVTYLCKVPFDEDTPHRFSRVHEDLKRVDAVFKGFHRIKKVVEHVPRFFMPGFTVAESVVTVNLKADLENDVVDVDFLDGSSEEPRALKTWRAKVSPQMAKEAAALSEAWKEVTDFVERERESPIFAHPAVLVTMHRTMIVSAYVNRCYLEKTELAWFRLEELESPDRWKHREDFRRHFLENVRKLAPQIRSLFSEEAASRHEETLPPRPCVDEFREPALVC
jgi:hypothetical protein